MPKGVKSHRRKGNGNAQTSTRELVFKEESECYALVTAKLGNGNLEVKCDDGQTRIGHIRGAMRKKVWMNPGDLVLVSLREFQDNKADITHKYSPDEYRLLKSYKELSDDILGTSSDGVDLPPIEDDVEFDIDDI